MEQDVQALIQRGIKAYQAGDTVSARKLLSQAVKIEKWNEEAWWYLAQAMDDPEKRHYCLQMVLKVNPDHAQAQEALMQGEAWTPTPPAAAKSRTTTNGSGEKPKVKAIPVSSSGIRIPPGIPDAPERYDVSDLIAFVQQLVQNSIAIVTGKTSDAEATWWRFYLMVGVTGFLTGLIADLAAILRAIFQRSDLFAPSINLWALITTPFIAALFALIAVGVGGFISHWFAILRGGKAALLDHSYRLAEIWVPGTLAMAVLGLIQTLIVGGSVLTLWSVLHVGPTLFSTVPTMILTAIAAGITFYTASLMTKALAKLHPMLTSRDWWLTALLALAVISLVFS